MLVIEFRRRRPHGPEESGIQRELGAIAADLRYLTGRLARVGREWREARLERDDWARSAAAESLAAQLKQLATRVEEWAGEDW